MLKLRFIIQIILVSVLWVNLVGCGQTGPLYLPTKTPPNTTTTAT